MVEDKQSFSGNSEWEGPALDCQRFFRGQWEVGIHGVCEEQKEVSNDIKECHLNLESGVFLKVCQTDERVPEKRQDRRGRGHEVEALATPPLNVDF